MSDVGVPEGFITGQGRDAPHEVARRKAHLYKGTFHEPGRPMCRRGFNRGSGYSIWRNNVGPAGICQTCMRRARAGKDSLPWPEDGGEGEAPLPAPPSPQEG